MAWKRGFTLIETLIAISLSALLLTVVYWTYFSINRSIDIASEGQEALETARILNDLLKQDLRGVIFPKYPLVAKTTTTEGKSLGDISFVTTSHLGPSPTGITKVGYSLVKDKDGLVILLRKETKNLTAELDQVDGAELTRIVSSMEFSFYNGTEWVGQWDSRITNSIPKQIKVNFEVTDAKGKPRTFTTNETIASSL
jgi:general secretion pathway protein J